MISSPGLFIVFEGGEGTGKSTQAALLASHLDALLTNEPGATPLGKELRRLCLDQSSSPTLRAEALMMIADRAQHVESVIRPTLDAGRCVVSDRFSMSTFVYQGFAKGLSLEAIKGLNDFACDGLTPDLTILIDAPPEVTIPRRAHRATTDRMEALNEEFHASVRQGFLTLAGESPHCLIIDGSPSQEEVAATILESLPTILPQLPAYLMTHRLEVPEL